MVKNEKKSLFWGVVALCASMQTYLHTCPMLRIHLPLPTCQFIPHHHPKYHLSNFLSHTCDMFQLAEDDIIMLESFYVWHMHVKNTLR